MKLVDVCFTALVNDMITVIDKLTRKQCYGSDFWAARFKKNNCVPLTMMKFLEQYYPIILAFLSFLYSVFLWFSGNQLEGIYVGLWPITILGFAIAIRQRRNQK